MKLMVPSSGSITHWRGAPGAVVPPSSPRMPAAGAPASRPRLTRSSAWRSVSVTTSVGDDLRPMVRACPYAAVTISAAARAAVDAMRSSSAGAGGSPASDTMDRDVVLRQGGGDLGVDARVGHEHIDLVERREAEHLHVAELGLVDHRDHTTRALDHGALDRVLLSIRRGEAVLERQPVATD